MASDFKNLPQLSYVWYDRKRWLGMPITFTKYRLSEDRLFLERGLLSTKSDEILLYRVRDISLSISLGQRLLGVGTVCVYSSDKSLPHLDIKNIKHPREVKELIHRYVERAKEQRRMKTMELMDGDDFSEGGPGDHDM